MRVWNVSLLLFTFALCCAEAEEVELKTERAFVLTFPSQSQRSYKLLGATNAAGTWTALQDGIVGTGGEVTIFYKSESDQKIFFKVQTSDGPPGQRSLLSLARLDLANQDLSGYNLEGADLRNFKFTGAKFDKANLVAANLSEANVEQASFQGADLSHAIVDRMYGYNANFNGANLEGVAFRNNNLFLADLRNAKLTGASFNGVALGRANLSGLNLANMNFQGSFLDEANLAGANLARANLSRGGIFRANITGADLTGANLEGSGIWDLNFAGRDLREMNLKGVSLGGDWTGVNGAGVDMSLASVTAGSRFGGANFEGANLEALGLRDGGLPGGFNGIILTNANLRNVKLQGANLSFADLRNADLTGANLSFANLTAANLTGAIGLDAEQPGIIYGAGPPQGPVTPPNPPGTIMPDGTFRNGTNPGTSLVPQLPARMLLNFADAANTSTLDLAFANGKFSHGVGGPVQGNVVYGGAGRVATLKLGYDCCEHLGYTLLFSSPTQGQLFKGIHIETAGSIGIYPVGTFTVPQ
jgi:uncharacterized protein YjbI with pentapeptide repeats